MRYQYLFILFCLLSANAFAQTTETDITGLWKGTLYNDSTQKYYKYEIGISEEKGKLTGFSHTWFLLDDKQYYGLKKVKIKRKDGKIIIEDDGLITNNYPVAPAKGIRQLNILVLDASDSVMRLTGPFTTNRTKDYAPLTGTIDLQRKNDYWQSALIPHLQELNLVNTLSFMNEDKLLAQNNIIIAATQPTVIATKSTIVDNKKKPMEIKNIPPPVLNEEVTASNETVKNETVKNETVKNEIIKTEILKIEPTRKGIVKAEPIKTDDPKKIDPKSSLNDIAKLNTNKSDTVYSLAYINNAPINKTSATPVAIQQPVENKTTQSPVSIAKAPQKIEVKTADKNISIAKTEAAADVEKRTTLLQQTVSFRSDSLQISLYDNGEVDGDTVSVLMNGNIIMAKERLSTNAVRKTIYIPQETDSVQLVMYAENLGLIPPNTGLLVVKDGKDLYEIRFSGDLQKNAAILFRRKKKDQ